METQQATPVLRYSRSHVDDQPTVEPAQATREASKLNEAVTWAVLSVCLVAWAVIGLFLWIPRLLRAVVTFSVRLVQSTLAETTAEAAGRSLRSAADFYWRGFVAAVDSIRRREHREGDERPADPDEPDGVEPGLLARETAWAIVTWYVILWVIGPLRGTPVDVAAISWSDLWSAWVGAVWSVPELFRT